MQSWGMAKIYEKEFLYLTFIIGDFALLFTNIRDKLKE